MNQRDENPGDGPPDPPRLPDTEHSDESALSYRQGYGAGASGGHVHPARLADMALT